MKLCVFQGTFNPIHKAHLDMAEFVLKNLDFEKILFIPAAIPPHKDYDEKLTFHRLKMAELATVYNPHFEVSDIEYKLGGKSYSYLTALQLYKDYEIDGKINFIIGTDAFEKIETWYQTDKFKNLVDFIVFVRENNFESDRLRYLKDKGYNFQILSMPFEDISSTELRGKIKSGETISNLVPKEVEDYIYKYELYKN